MKTILSTVCEHLTEPERKVTKKENRMILLSKNT